jgi:hypothetical protein
MSFCRHATQARNSPAEDAPSREAHELAERQAHMTTEALGRVKERHLPTELPPEAAPKQVRAEATMRWRAGKPWSALLDPLQAQV